MTNPDFALFNSSTSDFFFTAVIAFSYLMMSILSVFYAYNMGFAIMKKIPPNAVSIPSLSFTLYYSTKFISKVTLINIRYEIHCIATIFLSKFQQILKTNQYLLLYCIKWNLLSIVVKQKFWQYLDNSINQTGPLLLLTYKKGPYLYVLQGWELNIKTNKWNLRQIDTFK